MCENWSSLCSWVDAVAETTSRQIGIRFVTNELIFFIGSWTVGHLILTSKQEAQLGPQIMFEILTCKSLGGLVVEW